MAPNEIHEIHQKLKINGTEKIANYGVYLVNVIRYVSKHFYKV